MGDDDIFEELQTSCGMCLQADRAPVSPTKVTYRRPREESKPLALVGAQAVHPKRILKPEPKKVKAKTPEEKELEAAEQRALEHRAKIASLYRRKVSACRFACHTFNK